MKKGNIYKLAVLIILALLFVGMLIMTKGNSIKINLSINLILYLLIGLMGIRFYSKWIKKGKHWSTQLHGAIDLIGMLFALILLVALEMGK